MAFGFASIWSAIMFCEAKRDSRVQQLQVTLFWLSFLSLSACFLLEATR